MKTIFVFTLLILASLPLSIAQTPDSNKQVVRQFFEEVINKQKLDRLPDFVAEDFVNYNLDNLDNLTGSKGLQPLKTFYPQFFKAFPDVHFTVENMIAEGDKVFAQVTFTGTHKADFIGFPASNNKVKIAEIYFVTLKNSKMVELRRLFDRYSLTKQLSGK